MEPMVNNLLRNSTSANFLNNLDMNLINPYRIDVQKNISNNNKDMMREEREKKLMKKIDGFRNILTKKIENVGDLPMNLNDNKDDVENHNPSKPIIPIHRINSFHHPYFSFGHSPFMRTKPPVKLTIPNAPSMNIMSNIDNIQELIKNKTIDELQSIPESPLDIPGKKIVEYPHFNNENFLEIPKKSKSIFEYPLMPLNENVFDMFKFKEHEKVNK